MRLQRTVSVVVALCLALYVTTGCTADGSTQPADRPAESQSASTGGATATGLGSQPNILLITTDDQRWDETQSMPLMQAWFDEGTRFSDALSTHPLCCPARAQILTGQLAQNNGVRSNEGPRGGYDALVDPDQTLSTWLRDAGYRTGFIGKFLNGYSWRTHGTPLGWDVWTPLVSAIYQGYGFSVIRDGQQHRYGPRVHSNEMVTRESLKILRNTPTDQPFFVWSSFMSPHNSCRVVDEIRCKFDPQPARQDRNSYLDWKNPAESSPAFAERDVSDKPNIIRAHPTLNEQSRQRLQGMSVRRAQSLASVDRGIDAMLSELNRTDRLEDTVVIFLSDNGYLLGEHRFDGKDVPYEEALKIPLQIRGPGFDRSTVSYPVTLVDVAATIAAIGDSKVSRVLDGQDLGALVASERRDHAVLIHGGPSVWGTADWTYRGVRTPRFTYVEWDKTGLLELYDREFDPGATRNLATEAAYADVVAELAKRTRLLKNCAGPRSCNRTFGSLPPVATDLLTDR